MEFPLNDCSKLWVSGTENCALLWYHGIWSSQQYLRRQENSSQETCICVHLLYRTLKTSKIWKCLAVLSGHIWPSDWWTSLAYSEALDSSWINALGPSLQKLSHKQGTLLELDIKILKVIKDPDKLDIKVYEAEEIQDTIMERTEQNKCFHRKTSVQAWMQLLHHFTIGSTTLRHAKWLESAAKQEQQQLWQYWYSEW